MGQLFQELKRRNVIRVAIAYAVSAWLLIEVSATIFPILSLPTWSVTLVTVLLFIGFPIALIFAWAFEITPEGITLEKHVVRDESITHHTGRKLDFVIIAMLVVALGYFGYDKFILSPDRNAAEVEAAVKVAQEPVKSIKSIAVLAFDNMSDDPDNEYFSDGISEEILNLLAKVPELRVTSRSSAFSFKGQNLDVPTMAARLNVAHVLEGSVRKFGDQLRITAQLIDAESDTHLWSETYDRELKNVFAIQDEIAAAVVEALKITLLGKKLKAAETNPEAYALYLQARHFNNRGTKESYVHAETLLRQALAMDPGFAPAWTELGRVYQEQVVTGTRDNAEGNELARHAIQKALEIDPQYGRALAALASVEMIYDWDFKAASRHLQTALVLNPGDATILLVAGRLESILGRVDEAIDLFRRSVAVDPLSGEGHYYLGSRHFKAHHLEEAADSLKLALSLSPGGVAGHFTLGLVWLAQGDAPAALAEIQKEKLDGLRVLGTAVVQHVLGDAAASDAALEELIELGAAVNYGVAQVYASRGEIDHAFEQLEQAYDDHNSGLTGMLLDPLLANLQDDLRWERLLDKMGLPH